MVNFYYENCTQELPYFRRLVLPHWPAIIVCNEANIECHRVTPCVLGVFSAILGKPLWSLICSCFVLLPPDCVERIVHASVFCLFL